MEDITPAELRQRQQAGTAPLILDVREPWEHEETRIEGTQNIPLASLPDHLAALSDHQDQEIIVHCRSGARSAQAKAFLTQQGFGNVRNLLGGMMAWEKL